MFENRMSRRGFLGATAKSACAGTILGSIASGAPSAELRVAQVGCGGMGHSDYNSVAGHSSVRYTTFCDVDSDRLEALIGNLDGVKGYDDYRRMFDKSENDFDAVVISTPDHMHMPIAMRAMAAGKHVYCQKPLTQNIAEARQMQSMAAQTGVACQMGIQLHSTGAYRLVPAFIRSGRIGRIKEVHSWSFKDWGGRSEWIEPASHEVPENLNWDAWVGVSPWHDFARDRYHPGNWRRWMDFGCGTQGDMAPHMLDPVCDALDLGYPTSVFSENENPYENMWANEGHCLYKFPKTPYTVGEMNLHWYDGRLGPDRSLFRLEEGRSVPREGSLFIGEKGNLVLSQGGSPQLLPEDKFSREEIRDFVRGLGVSGGNHYAEWVNAALNNDPGQCSTDFDYSALLTEICLLGTIAKQYAGELLEWNAEELEFTNKPEAAKYIHKEYRTEYQA